MSSSPSVAKVSAISSPLRSPSGFAKFALKSPVIQQSGSLGALLERFEDPLYRQGVFGGELTSHNVPLPRPRLQLEANDVGSKFLDGLHRKMWRRPVEDCHSAVVSARRVRRDNAISS